MSAETDAVLSDYLQAAGYRLTVWHVRCVEAYLADQGQRYGNAESRLVSDLYNDLDALHVAAQWYDARWVVERQYRDTALSA